MRLSLPGRNKIKSPTMKLFRNEEAIEKKYHVSIYVLIYEFVVGFFELLAGLAMAFFGSQIYEYYRMSLIKELSEDPPDVLAYASEKIVPGLLTHNAYIILYLVVLGLGKVVGAIGLYYKQNWGVDLLVVLIILMAPFQVYELIARPNLAGLLALIGALLIALYLVEFRPAAWVSRILKRK